MKVSTIAGTGINGKSDSKNGSKRKLKSIAVLCLSLMLMLTANFVFGQLSITSTGSAFTQNFNGMGSSATATLPTGFRIGTDWSTGTTATTVAYGSTGTGVVNGTSAGGVVNWANGVTASATDRSLGFLTTNGFTSPRSIILRITNNTGSTIGSVDIAFDYEKTRSGSRQIDWTFFHGSSSAPSTAATSGDQSYAADANNTTISNPPTTTSKSFTISGLSIANGADYYFRWTYTGLAGSTNSQGIGIDNFSITAAVLLTTPSVTTTTASSITTTSASSGGNVTADGGASVSARGVAYGISANPTTSGTITSDGTGTGTFSSSLTSLSVNTQYFYRAYATNSQGTAYGSESSFYTLANTPGTPTVNGATTSSLDVTLDANSNPAATEFAIQETGSGNYVQANGSLGGTAVWQTAATWGTKTVTGLSVNTSYSFQVKARNGASVETGFGSSASLFTLANTPGAPTVNNATATTLDVTVAVNSNPSTTQFAIQETGSSNYVQADGTLGGTAIWQTAATWGTIAVNGLTSATSYTFQVKARNGNNVETGFGATAGGTTLASGTPVLTANTLSAFGNVCLNVTTSANTFTITGNDLTTANVTVASLSGFTFSTDDITYTSSLSIAQGGGSFSQLIYVKFTPTAVQSYDGNIVVGGGGASSINVAASGSGINTAPTVTAGAATGVTISGATVPGTISSIGCSAITAYGVEYSTTASFANGTGTAVAGSNLSGNDFSVTLSGLSSSTTYYYHTYATNNGGTSYSAEGSFTTLTPTLSVSALTGFGNVCTGVTAGPNTFTITGTNLSTDNVTVAALNGFTYSTDNVSYASSLTFVQGGGSFSQLIYVKFSPILVQSYDGDIVVGGGGAANVNRSVTGSGIDNPVTVNTTAATSVTQVAATLNGNFTVGCSAVTGYGFEYSTTNGFANGTGTNVSSSNESAGVFSAGISGLSPNTTYYYKAYASDGTGSVYGSQQSFTTANLDAPVATAATDIDLTSFTANWNAVTGADSYRLDVSANSSFTTPSTFASEGFNNALTLFTNTGGTFSTGNSNSADRPQSYPFAFAGTHAFGMTNGTATLTSSNINTTTLSNPRVTFKLASFSIASAGNGADAGDIVTVEISPNGGTNYFSTVRVLGNSNAFWNYEATGTATTSYDGNTSPVDFSPAGGGSRTTDGYSTITINNLPSATNVRIRITLLNNATGERWVIDDLKVISDIGSFIPGYENLTVNGLSQSVTGLTSGTSYYYRVRAFSTSSTSANSNVITATTCTASPVSVSIAANPGTTVCAGTFVTFTATPTNGGTAPTYQWYNGANPISGETNDTYTTNSLVDGDQISVVMTSNATCISGNPATSNTLTMTINPLPTVSFSGLSASYCATGIPATLTGSPAGGTFSGTGISGNTFDPAAAGVGGPYTITYTYTNENGCTNTSTQDVSVTASVSVDWANLQWPPTGTICEGGSHTAYGQVYEAGVTEAGGQGAGILVEIGYSSTNSNPNTWTNWQAASFNTQVGNNDEYMATFGDNLAAGTYYYTFRYSLNGCGYSYGGYSSGGGNFWDGTTYVSGVLTVNPSLTPSVSISANPGTTICAGSSVTFTATPTNGGTAPTYQWYNGANPIGGETASTYTTSSIVDGDQISVVMVSNATPCLINNPATSNTLTMTVIANLPASVSISANPGSTICAGTSVTFTATPTNGGTTPTYQWYNGANPISGETANTYTSSSLVNGDQISVVMTSNETCTSGNPATSNTITMTVNASQPVSVSIAAAPGNAICPGTSVTFTATPTNGGTAPTYQWYNGVNPISGETASTYTTTTLVDGDQISVVMTSDITPCATGNPATSNTITMTVYAAANTPGAISGPIDACPLIGSLTPTTYSISAVAGAVSYQWTIPVGTSLVSGQGSTSIDVLFDNTFALTNSQFKVRAVTADGCISAPSALIVNKNIPGIPTAINGPTNACPFVGQPTNATYTIDPVQYATSYTWTVQGTGISLVSGQGSTSVQVSYASNFNTGVIRVVANSNCGSRTARSLNISRQIPSAPVAINGTTNVCSFIGTNTQVTYTIDPVANATSYTWTVPANVTLVSGQGSTSINVTFNTGFATSVLKVKSVSNCFTSGDRQLILTAASTSTPGAISGPNNACTFIGTANEATYTIRKVTSAVSYNWTVPTGVTITGHPGGTGVNDTIINVTFDNSFVSGTNISVQAVNCNVSSPRNYTVFRYTASTPGLISGPTNACEYMISANLPSGAPATYTVRKVANATSYNWIAPVNATITAHPGGTGVNDTIVEVTYNSNFTGGTVQVSASNGCGSSNLRSLTVTRQTPGTPGGIDIINTQTCPNRQYTYTLAAMPSNATSILWTVPSGATIVSGQGTTSITVSYPATAVNGTVTATAQSNCANSNTRSITVKLAACPLERLATVTGKGGTTAAEAMNVQVFPNPTTTDFKLQVLTAGKEKINARILDAQGRMIRQITVQPYQTVNFGTDLKAGAYILEVRQGNTVKSTRITKF